MKRFLTFSLLFVIFSCKQKVVVVETSVAVDEIETYVNEIESFIHHINISTKDNDSININELKLLKNAHKITLNVSDKKVIYRNKKIVKAKYKDYSKTQTILL